MTRVVVVTSAVGLIEGFVRDRDLHRRIGVEVMLLVRTHPSMKPRDRLHDLRRGIERRARMTGRSRVAHLVEHFAWRAVHGAAFRDLPTALSAPVPGLASMEALSTHDPSVVRALADVRADLAVVFGGSPIPARTIDAMGVPLLNVHASDPSFCRGMPPVFWEVHAGLDALTLTLHEIVARLDAGAVVAQRTMPIAWRRSLTATLRATRDRMALELPLLLADGLEQIVRGEAHPRGVPPGPLRTLPRLGEILEAQRRCTRRWRARD
jgi:folate-dependent phosphoribosylglycinamide formyltransferase PurN